MEQHGERVADVPSCPKDGSIKSNVDAQLDEALDESFPASDPPALIQPSPDR